MKIEETYIQGLYVFSSLKFSDLRGDLIKPYSEQFFKDFEKSVNLDFKEIWFTKSSENVIRAMHMQVGNNACEKLVSVISGAVLDVILDLRKDSETFGKWFEIELNEELPYSIYIPIGCAHGYKVLKDNTITMYMATDIHDANNDIGICWNSFGYDWQIKNPILSNKDLNLPSLNTFIEHKHNK